MAFAVLLTDDAARDVEENYSYIAQRSGRDDAEYVLTQIERVVSTLSSSPERGVYPKELLALGIREYRELFFKPYRIIYTIIAQHVYVLLVADGRRDMQTHLFRRLLDG